VGVICQEAGWGVLAEAGWKVSCQRLGVSDPAEAGWA